MSFSVGFRVLGLERCLLVCDGFRAPGSGFSGWGEGRGFEGLLAGSVGFWLGSDLRSSGALTKPYS